MTAAVSTIFPPAGRAVPAAEMQEQALGILRQELAACTDRSLSALLLHEMARLHERREDLAAAARDELAATKHAAGFVEPVETLVRIALRSHSHSNLTKLLERLLKLAKTDDERLRAHLCLVFLFRELGQRDRALAQLESALEELPSEATLWLSLEVFAELEQDTRLLRRAAVGRAAHAESTELRSMMLERVARLDLKAHDEEGALSFVKQSIDERPTWRALHAWETMAVRLGNHVEAGLAATQVASVIRAAQAEPEEAPLYQVPGPELNEERAFCAQMRSLLYAARNVDWELANVRTEELLELWPNEPLALATAAVVAKRTQNSALEEVSLRTLLDHFGAPSQDRAILAASLWLISAGSEAKKHAAQALAESAPQSWAAQALRFTHALDEVRACFAQGDNSAALARLGTSIEEVLSSGPPRTVALARALFWLAEGDIQKAAEVLATAPPSSSYPDVAEAFLQALRQGSGASRGTTGGGDSSGGTSEANGPSVRDRAAITTLQGETERDRATLDWAQLRLDFLSRGSVDRERRQDSPALGREPLLRLLLGLLDADRPASDSIHSFPRGESPPELNRAIDALGRMLTDRGEQSAPAEPHWPTDLLRDENLDPLVLGAVIQQATAQATLAPRDLLEATERVRDPQLGAAWSLMALLLALERKSPADTERALARLSALDKSLSQIPLQWLSALDALDDPHAQLSYFDAKKLKLLGGQDPTDPLTDPAADRRLDFFFLLHALRREDLLFTARAAAQAQALTPAEQVLIGLAASLAPEGFAYPRQSIPSFEAVLSPEVDRILELSDPASCADIHLLLADLAPPQGALEGAPHDAPTTGDVSCLFASWVAAKRQQQAHLEASSCLRLALALDDPTLLSSVDPAQLDEEARGLRRSVLLQHLERAPQKSGGGPGIGGEDDEHRAPTPSVAGLAWTLCEEAEPKERSAALGRLASAIDPEFKDADAQLAALCAGVQLLMTEDFEGAIACFEPLLAVLPSDLTLCQALRLASQRVGRSDLEAEVTRELARHAVDSRTSADLWETAGLLYQDHLGDPLQAEECFNAALAQNPGSPIAFERLYRFARAKKDRPRQLDLIEARLVTAESETLVVELLWEKARHCRILGRPDEALSAVEDLSRLAPDHLPSLALSAELYLGRGKQLEAAETLRRIALHPDTPLTERKSTGFFCSELLEKLGKSRAALELLKTLEELGVQSNTSLLRKARSLAKSGEFEEAYEAFLSLNDQQDRVLERRESAQVLLALQRDHLRQPGRLKDAVRRVLRDDPLHEDALRVALGLDGDVLPMGFEPGEQRRLFAPARKRTVEALRNRPLDAANMQLLARLCAECESEGLERVAWGLLSLTGNLAPDQVARLRYLRDKCPLVPSHAWSPVDLDQLSATGQLGAMRSYAETLAPVMARALEPSLEGMGIGSLMRVPDYSEHPIRRQVTAWCSAFGIKEFQLFIGGFDGDLIRAMNLNVPTILIGAEVSAPLSRVNCARLAAQIQSVRLHSAVLLNEPVEATVAWCEASRLVAEGTTSPGKNPLINEIARDLGHAIGRSERETLKALLLDLNRARHDVRNLPDATLFGATRAAAVAFGDPSIVREIPALLPKDTSRRNAALSDLIRFCLSDHFAGVRKRAGLEAG